MNAGIIAAAAAIFGSLVGALGSVVGTWITQRHQDIRDLLAKTIVRRESLYSDFIAESARLLVDAMVQNNSDPQKLIALYAVLSRIRLSSSAPVLETAEAVIRNIVSTYPKPNLTPEQMESRAVSGDDPLRQFSDACRMELDSLQRQL
jgi:hypothetical protein